MLRTIHEETTNLAEAMSLGNKLIGRVLTYWHPAGEAPLGDYMVQWRIEYSGEDSAPLFRMLTHKVGLCGGTMGHDETLFPATPLGLLVDAAVSGTGWTGGVSVEVAFSYGTAFSCVTPKVEFLLEERQDTYWKICPVGHWDVLGHGPERAYELLGAIRGACPANCLVARAKLYSGYTSRERVPQVFRRNPPGSERYLFAETPWVTYFCDPGLGIRTPKSESFAPGMPLPTTRDFGAYWGLGSDRTFVFDTLGVLVTGSPRMLKVAENLRIRVRARQKLRKFSCEIPVGELKTVTSRRRLPFGWIGSVPFSLPFALSPGREQELELSLLARESELRMIQELEAMCPDHPGKEIWDSPEFLGVTPYLVGVGYFDC